MVFLVLIGLAAALFAGFLSLTSFETQRGARVLAVRRTELDRRIAHLEFILTHVNFEAFLREQVRALVARLAHDTAHYSLLAVRAIERLLTRAVKHLRTNHNIPTVRTESARPFVKAMSDFKQQLSATRPALSTTTPTH